MSRIVSCGTSTGKVELTQSDLREFTYNLFSRSMKDIDRLITVFDNSSIKNRHISVPVSWLKNEHSFSERNKIFVIEAVELAKKAIENCMRNSTVSLSDIDSIIMVTSTGISTPTLDSILFNELKLKTHITRTPLWGLGCAGGAAGISKAMEYTMAYPEKNALVVAVELCSLTFQRDDLSKSNVVAASLFSDGAAAAIIAGDKSKHASGGRVRLVESMSTIYDKSLDVMGWEIVDDGFRVIFSRDIPSIVRERVYPNIMELAASSGISLNGLKHFITHPGGIKVIRSYEESLSLPEGTLNLSRKVLQEHGNMSSPSVIFVLEEFLNASEYKSGEYGILSALGPGFSSELVLFNTL